MVKQIILHKTIDGVNGSYVSSRIAFPGGLPMIDQTTFPPARSEADVDAMVRAGVPVVLDETPGSFWERFPDHFDPNDDHRERYDPRYGG